MSYSDYWRVNKSYIGHEELANSLRALRKVVGYLGIGIDTLWTGLPALPEEEMITLPLHLAQGSYPIPSEKMDVLVGLAVHEALHLREDRQHAWGYLAQMFPRMNDKRDLQKLADAGEDIHVEGVALKMGLLGKYVQKSRAWHREESKNDLTLGLPNEDGLLGIWMDIVLDGVFPFLPHERIHDVRESIANIARACGDSLEDISLLVETLCDRNPAAMHHAHSILLGMPRDYSEPLHMLLLKTLEIVEGGPEDRALLYYEIWHKLEATFAHWNMAIQLEQVFEDPGGNGSGADKRSQVEHTLTSQMSQAILTGLADEPKDVSKSITSHIKHILMRMGGASDRNLLFETTLHDATEPCKTAPHRKLVQRLKEVFQLERKRSTRTVRGLPSGKLDSKRLYRAYTTGMAFKQKEVCREDTEWNIMLLLDASGSVGWCWEFLESVYAALVEALVEGDANLDVYAYREKEMVCELTRLLRDHSLYTMFPSGATPTGEAVIAAGLMMPQSGRRLMIHVTDGLWNTGIDTWYALEFCRKQNIELVTLGCGSAEEALELQYGKDFELLGSVEALPGSLEALLRRKLLGGYWACSR
jgi:hypothetical protein